MKKIKILFLIDSLFGGGAERALVNLVEQLDKNKYDITVKTIYDSGIYINEIKKYVKYESAKIHPIRGINYLYKFIPSKILHNFIVKEHYDIEIAFLEGITSKIVSGAGENVKKVCWVRIDVEKYLRHEVCYLTKSSIIESYKKMDRIAFVGNEALESFRRRYKINDNLYVVRNIFKYDDMLKKSKEYCAIQYKAHPVFGSVGRLVEQKGYDRLLNVHIRLMKEGLKHSIVILGSGILHDEIEKKIVDNNVQESFLLLGFKKNPFKYMKTFDWFISTSLYEGFSSVIREAIILNIPVIATECSGIKEVLGENEYGIVLDNSEEAIYEGMKRVLLDKNLLNEYTLKVKKRSEFFNYEETVKCNKRFIENII